MGVDEQKPAAADDIAALELIASVIEEDASQAHDQIGEMARIKLASKAQWAKLWNRITPYLVDEGIDRRKFDLAVGDEAKRLAAERREQERLETLATAKRAGVPTFRRGDNAEISWVLYQTLHDEQTPLAYDYGRVWRYRPKTGHYAEVPDAALSTRVQDWSGAPLLQGEKLLELRINSTRPPIEMLKDRLEHETPPEFFATARPCVSCRDTTLVIQQREVIAVPHSPEHRCDTHIEVEYDPDAEGEWLTHYLSTVFEGEDDEADKQRLLRQVAGAAAFGLTTMIGKKAIMVVGKKGTGKSTYLELVEGLVPAAKRSYIPPQQFGEDYHGAGLAGKRLNVVYETPEDDILGEAGIKAIVHGEPIRRREPYGRAIEFRPIATHLFAANSLPAAPGTTEAFWDRWAICEFRRRFRNTDSEIGDLAKTILSSEMDALLAWAAKGAQDLIDQGGFVVPESSRMALEEWSDSRPVKLFADQCLVHGDPHFSTAAELLEHYSKWAPKNGFSSKMNVYTFGRRLSEYVDRARTKNARGYKARYDANLAAAREEEDDEFSEIPF